MEALEAIDDEIISKMLEVYDIDVSILANEMIFQTGDKVQLSDYFTPNNKKICSFIGIAPKL